MSIIQNTGELLILGNQVHEIISEADTRYRDGKFIEELDSWVAFVNKNCSETLPQQTSLRFDAAEVLLEYLDGVEQIHKTHNPTLKALSIPFKAMLGNIFGAAKSTADVANYVMSEKSFVESDGRMLACSRILRSYNAEVLSKTEVNLALAKARIFHFSVGRTIDFGGQVSKL